jgi:predicted nucleic acid-binding protein
MSDSQGAARGNYLDSAVLNSLRDLIELYPALQQMVGQLPRLDIVLDANIAIADLLHRHRNPQLKQTLLEEAFKSGTLQIYAPRWLETEMLTSTIPQVSKKKKISQEALLTIWESYKAIIIFDERYAHPEELANPDLDTKDTPYVELQKSISALGILSNDKDIEVLGGTKLDRKIVLTLCSYARAASYSVSIKIGSVVVSHVSLSLFKVVVLSLGSVVSRMPDWMKLLLLIGGCLVLAHPSSRERLISLIRSVGQGVVDVWPDIERFLAFASEKITKEQAARADLTRATMRYVAREGTS